MKKVKIYTEVAYVLGIAILSFSVAILTKANFGVSMIVAPAYIVSEAIPLTFGQTEYVLQAILFVGMCLVMRRFRVNYLCTFITTIIYGAMLDGWIVILDFKADSLPFRIALLSAGLLLTAFSIAIFFRCYLPPQVYDYFVKQVSERFNFSREKFKLCFDFSFLILAIVLDFAIFHKFHGVGIGTVIATCFNAVLINMFGKILDKTIIIKPASKKLESWFTR